MQAIMVCCYVALLVVLVVLQAASAIDAPHGAYLGCFDATKVSLAYQVNTRGQANKSTLLTIILSALKSLLKSDRVSHLWDMFGYRA